MAEPAKISENSRRIARNTLFLYIRMLVLMFVGLYTSRIVLQALGVSDYGVYNAVGGVVSMFTMVTATIAAAISRFLAFELGHGNTEKLKRIFSTSVIIQICFCLLLVLLTETAGLWFLKAKMVIPEGSTKAAFWVLQCSMGAMIVSLISTPFNALIVAHEKMNAFAFISILEGVLKLCVALCLLYGGRLAGVFHREIHSLLILYAVLMVAVQLIIRFTYSMYCRRHFEESRTKLTFDKATFKEMFAFAGWNYLGVIPTVCNTVGISLLTNLFFGVLVNAARGVASQVESTVRQFVTSFTTALNPQITKSYSSGRTDYAFHLVCKGSEYSFLLMMLFIVPVCYEGSYLLEIWLKNVPEWAVLFSKLTLIGSCIDLVGGPLAQLAMATGKVRKYYIWVGGTIFFVLPISIVLFKLGFPAYVSYITYIAVYIILIGVKLAVLYKQTGFPWKRFLMVAIVNPAAAVIPAATLSAIPFMMMEEGIWRLLAVLAVNTAVMGAAAWLFVLTDGEKSFVTSRLSRFYKR